MASDPDLDTARKKRQFLAGGGQMGAAIRAFDWSSTSLGDPACWPDSLRVVVRAMLTTNHPIFIFWGPEHICLYNDAYSASLGPEKHPSILGGPGRVAFDEIWHIIGPQIDLVMAGKGATWHVDHLVPSYRHGKLDEVYWTYSYSPIDDEAADNSVGGVLVICKETTGEVLARRERDELDRRLKMALSAGGGIGTWDWDVPANRVTADRNFATLYGVDPAFAAKGAPIETFFSGVHPLDLPRLQKAIEKAMSDGSLFREDYRLVQPDGSLRWVSAQGRCMLDDEGRCIRFPGVSFDITDRRKTQEELEIITADRELIIELAREQRALSDPDEIMRAAASRLGLRLGVDRAAFFRVVGEDMLRMETGWTRGTLPLYVGDIRASQFGETFMTDLPAGRPIVVNDVASDPRDFLRSGMYRSAPAAICVPIVRDGIWTGGMFVGSLTVRAWSQAEISLVEAVADMTTDAVERAEAMIQLSRRVINQREELAIVATDLQEQLEKRQAAENLVRQMQKMEAIGQLTGGLAHDFNNMLAVVIGGLNLIQRKISRGDYQVEQFINGAMDGAQRAASLTQRLLAFARQQPLAPESIDANRMVAGMTDLLTRTLGEQVRVETVLSAGLWRAKADPSQLENVILNLAVNGRDAMENNGRLTIETANTHVDRDYAEEFDVPIGQYVMVAVTDTGSGMTPEIIDRAFEPFFTTKGVGKGTGLGLSQVFGFARQSGGHVKIYSEVGVGTTVKIYLPRFYGAEQAVVIRKDYGKSPGGVESEIVLVVEDEERVRHFSTAALRELGYTVIHAAGGEEALKVIAAGQQISLLFTDVVMPGMTGRQLADAALQLRPGLKVLYTTGYTRNAVVHNGVIDPGTNFLAKPFSIDQLAIAIRHALDG